ncbi:MAG: hypothetical protein ACP5UD_08950 [Conexivisphaera sp.]
MGGGVRLPAEVLQEHLQDFIGRSRSGEGGQAFHVVGHPKSGKTTAVDRALGGGRTRLRVALPDVRLVDGRGAAVDPGSLRGRVVLELPSSFHVPGYDPMKLRERVQDLVYGLGKGTELYMVEANGYVVEFLRSSDSFSDSFGVVDESPRGEERFRRLKEAYDRAMKFAEALKDGRGEEVVIRLPPDHFEVGYDEGQARRLAEELAGRKLGDDEMKRILRYARVNHGPHRGRYFPGLISSAVREPSVISGGSEGRWDKWEEAEKTMAIESGLAAGLAVAIGDVMTRGIEEAVMSLLPATIPLAAASIPFVAYLGWSKGRKKGGTIGEFLELWRAWREMPEERREYLAYQYDVAMRLVPGTARAWLDIMLGVEVEELRGALDALEEYLSRYWASLGGVEPLESDFKLRTYYEVQTDEDVSLSKSQRTAVEELRGALKAAYSREAPRLLVLTGPSGVGKSWAAYALVSSLAREGEPGRGGMPIYKVNEQAASNPLPPEGSIPPWVADRRPVMVLDDRYISIGERVGLTLDGLKEKLKNVGDLGMPLVLSISRGRWESLRAGLPGLEEHAKVVEIKEWEYEEVEELARRISGELGIGFEGGALEELVNRSGGIPLVASIFLRSFAKRNPGGRVRKEDLVEVTPDLGEYILGQISRNYAQGLFTLSPDRECYFPDLRTRVRRVYNFLHAAALLGGAPAGYVKCLLSGVDEKERGMYGMLAALEPGGYPPLFVNDRGILRPQHPSIAGVIEEVVSGSAKNGDEYLRCVGAIIEHEGGAGALLSRYLEDIGRCAEDAANSPVLFGPYFILSLLVGLKELEGRPDILGGRSLKAVEGALMRALADERVKSDALSSPELSIIAEQILYLMNLYVDEQEKGILLLDYYSNIARNSKLLDLLSDYARIIGRWFPSMTDRGAIVESTFEIAKENEGSRRFWGMAWAMSSGR